MRAAIADGVAATGSMQPAAAAGVPAMDLNAAKTGIDFGQMLQAVRRLSDVCSGGHFTANFGSRRCQ